MVKTIQTKFDFLPKWAKNYASVVALAERDLAYRCNVCQAKAADYRRHLIRVAEIVASR